MANNFRVEFIPPDNPSTVRVTPMLPANQMPDELGMFGNIAMILRREARNIAQRQVGNVVTNSQRVLRATGKYLLTIGYLQMINIDNNAHAHIADLQIQELDAFKLAELFNRAHSESNPDLTVYTVEWEFWVNPISLTYGSGRLAKPMDHTCDIANRTYEYDGVQAGCAAICVAVFLVKHEPEFRALNNQIRRKTSHKRIYDLAIQKQNEFEWETAITPSQFEKFVETYPQYRVVVLNPLMRRSSIIFEGQDYQLPTEINNTSVCHSTMWIYLDHQTEHYYMIKNLKLFIQKIRGKNSLAFCQVCVTIYYANSSCCCYEEEDLSKKYRISKATKYCQNCGEYATNIYQHKCGHSTCITCYHFIKRGQECFSHRCVVYDPKKPPPIFKFSDDGWVDEGVRRSKCLWVYDIEACLELREEERNQYRDHIYETDDDGYFTVNDEGTLNFYTADRYHQIPNFIVYKNVFTDQVKKTRDMNVFIRDMLYNENEGHNVVIAHNASGYDSRQLLDALLKYAGREDISMVCRGSKIMRLSVNNTVFQDSLLHLVGSLKSLANDYLKNVDGLELSKGYFPHLFNRAENYDYEGPIPDKRYFDLAFTVNDQKGYDEFHEWYESQRGRVWNFQTELDKYCTNDVDCLAAIVKIHHELCTNVVRQFEPEIVFSPWQSTTAAGYVHSLFLRLQAQKLQITSETTVQEIEELAANNWAVLTIQEYVFARKALRGGRTEIRKFYYNGPIKDLDIQSEYPFCQLTKTMQLCGEEIPVLYPTGFPTIEIFDIDLYPCVFHPEGDCSCDFATKEWKGNRKHRIVYQPSDFTDLHGYINNFFGIIMVDVLPPNNLYHPVLPYFDPEQKKCVFTLQPLIKQTFCSVELQLAIKKGYTVTKIYRADRYKASPSNWTGLLGELYKLKMYNSQKAPDLETQARFKTTYREKFNIDINFDDWDKRPAAKKSGKILINSGWGKHAETDHHEKTVILNHKDKAQASNFYQALVDKDKHLLSFVAADHDTIFKYKDQRSSKNSKTHLHRTYLPCAVFVPMYGRLMLYNHLDKLQERVLMCDTDSIKYIDIPGEYQIEEGDCLGDWEDEGPSTEFVALCPKSYGQRPANGNPWFKCKGVNLRRAHEKLFNFNEAKRVLMEAKKIAVPQMTFDYNFTRGIRTRHYDKVIQFDETILKGNYNPRNYQLYPFGFASP